MQASPNWDGVDQGYYTRLQKPEKVITFLTADGIVTLSDSRGLTSALQEPLLPPRRLQQPLPTFAEQGLCVAATFLLAASNGRDGGARRIQVLGFCRSVDLLSEAVEDTVLSCGGEVWHRDSVPRAGCLENRLEMTVALPYLWGVPPAFDTLSEAIHMGGGVIHKITKQWQLL